MNKVTFTNLEQYQEFLSKNKENLYFQIIDEIQKAYENEIDEAIVHNVILLEDSSEYVVSIERKNWHATVQDSLQNLKDTPKINDLLDGYLFLKKLEESAKDL